MSGGNLDYAYRRVEEVAQQIFSQAQTPLHRAFAEHLLKVSKALYELEWLLSGDTAPGDEVEAIRAVVSRTEEIDAATKRAGEAMKELNDVLTSTTDRCRHE